MGLMDFFKKKNSGDIAKDKIKNDIIQVISKYMEIDAEGLDIQITQTESETSNGTVPALYANIPIKDMRHNSGNVQA